MNARTVRNAANRLALPGACRTSEKAPRAFPGDARMAPPFYGPVLSLSRIGCGIALVGEKQAQYSPAPSVAPPRAPRPHQEREGSSMTGRDVRELREATGHSLEELSAMLKRSKKLAPLMREQNRGISRAALSRLELAEDEEVEPPELVEWLLQLAPKPDKKEEYEKYLARKATASHGGQQAPSLAMPEPPDAPATTSPEPAAEVNPSLAMPSGALPAAGGVPASAAEKPAGAPEPLAQTRTPSPAPPEPIPTRGEQPPSPLLPLPATRESEVEALHAEKARKMEQSVRRTEAALQRAEQLLIEEEGRRQEQSRRMEESVRRAESMAQRAEQLYRELEARRTDDAGHA
ncbi:MAG TPA: hypothetical protein VK447_08870, partial [Myxococcaceae bacterium]|nr:hypothetical protein [Myxococcaceae bacterium]